MGWRFRNALYFIAPLSLPVDFVRNAVDLVAHHGQLRVDFVEQVTLSLQIAHGVVELADIALGVPDVVLRVHHVPNGDSQSCDRAAQGGRGEPLSERSRQPRESWRAFDENGRRRTEVGFLVVGHTKPPPAT
jgi:hypothetical protein